MFKLKQTSVALLLLAMPVFGAHAQSEYPMKPVKIVIGFPPGGPTDIVGRPFAAKLSQLAGQQFIIENRAGANGIIAADFVAKSPADGYTVYLATTGALLSPILSPKISYDLLKDFTPVALLATVPAALVAHPSLPVKNARELAALAKARPGQLTYASSGNASMGNLGMESFKLAARIDILHIPYKGAAPATTDLIGGHVQVAMLSLSILQPQVKAGRLRALAMVSGKRAATMPEVPSMAESGYADVNADNWFGMLAPIATPREVVMKLHAALAAAADAAETKERLSAQGVDVGLSTPENFAAFLR
ncbi:MAG TPA: tripartite tricarboxylate transporter substrate binding protein, partial [Burkholderiales bacterium]|nr:tripartite tricarboxylate transporter substrate binding protein [Burkholderiales bacterium]